ncbi:MAG: hypothetical protein AAF928_12550 [Myxococcota bacterium]
MTKFSSQLDARVLEQLRTFAKESHRTLASVLNEAATEYLARARVRPGFRETAEVVMTEHEELLRRLAK